MLAGFALFNAVTAVSSAYPLTFAARLLAGVMGGTLWSMLAGYAARMVPADRRGRAIAVAGARAARYESRFFAVTPGSPAVTCPEPGKTAWEDEWVPELPEVEMARSLIADHALHRRIAGVDDADAFVCRPHSPGELRDALVGRALTAAGRRGKTMWCETSGTGRSTTPGPDLGIHLGMGGRIVVTPASDDAAQGDGPDRRGALARTTRWNRFTLEFADGGSLVLVDKRRLGRVRLDPDVEALGPDAGQLTPAQFRGLIARGTIAVKARLLDQSKIAGIGNLLADEMLWKARVSPSAPVDSLQRQDIDRLYRALQSALGSAIAKGGVHTGEVISARHAGGECPRCGAEMKHATIGGRSTWWCSREQAS